MCIVCLIAELGDEVAGSMDEGSKTRAGQAQEAAALWRRLKIPVEINFVAKMERIRVRCALAVCWDLALGHGHLHCLAGILGRQRDR